MYSKDEIWDHLWEGIRELSEHFESRLVFIGGVAVYLHVRGAEGQMPPGFVEHSHDGDFYISFADFGELREIEEVTQNMRLHKHQVIKNGVDFDVYRERSSSLIVKYEDVYDASTVIDGVRVACLEHLLLLKLDAYGDRRGTAKGRKDERDLIRIAVLMNRSKPKIARLEGYLTQAAFANLIVVGKSTEFMSMCRRNAHEAKKSRQLFEKTVTAVKKAL